MMNKAITLAAIAAATLGSACVETPDFPDSSLVDRPRVLAIVAEPPEVAPGEDSALSVMLGGFDEVDYRVRWTACGAFSTVLGGTQYGQEDRKGGCSGEFVVSLGEGMEVTLPGTGTAALFADVDVATAALGDLLPPDAVELVKEQVGLALTIEADVETEGYVWRATKKVIINTGAQHTNPPLPHFKIDDVEVVADADAPFACQAASGEAVALEAGVEVELVPQVDGDEEPWLETYDVLNVRGELSEREEQAFYSWYSDGGKLAEETTRAPLRNNVWKTPGRPGCYFLWTVVRDGHGGTSACRLSVVVGDGGCD